MASMSIREFIIFFKTKSVSNCEYDMQWSPDYLVRFSVHTKSGFYECIYRFSCLIPHRFLVSINLVTLWLELKKILSIFLWRDTIITIPKAVLELTLSSNWLNVPRSVYLCILSFDFLFFCRFSRNLVPSATTAGALLIVSP